MKSTSSCTSSPRVTVIIPTYKRPALLPRAVRSALASARSVEVIVVNDACPDPRTRMVCDHLEAVTPNLRVIHLDHNSGAAAARNVGLKIACGEYVLFHDDDDVRVAGSCDREADLLDAEPEAGFCHAYVELYTPDGKAAGRRSPSHLVAGDCFREIAIYNPIQCISVLARLSMVNRLGGFDPDRTLVDDWDMWLRLSAEHPVAALPEIVGTYRETQPNTGQLSASLVSHLRGAHKTQAKAFRSERGQREGEAWQREAENAFNLRACDWLLHYATEALQFGLTEQSRQAVDDALRLNPRRATSRRVAWLRASLALSKAAAPFRRS